MYQSERKEKHSGELNWCSNPNPEPQAAKPNAAGLQQTNNRTTEWFTGLYKWMAMARTVKQWSAVLPAPVAQWLARRTVGRKVWGSNPIRVMWDFSALAGSYPELGVLWAQWEGWNHTAELHPLNGCVFEGVALIIWPTLQVPQFPGLVNTGIIVTVSVVCGPVK